MGKQLEWMFFENIILNRLEEYLWTSDYQFGYKSGHSTDLCQARVQEFVRGVGGQNLKAFFFF